MTTIILLADTFFYLPETVWQAIIAAVVTLVLAYFQRKNALEQVKKTKEATDNIVQKVDDAESHAEDELRKVQQSIISTKKLVNSGALKDLKKHEKTADRLAEITGDKRDIATAAEAKEEVVHHEQKQVEVDIQEEKDKTTNEQIREDRNRDTNQ